MKVLKGIALGLAVVLLGLAGLYFAMAERVEVVVVHTHGADGDHATRVWVVDDAGHAWLRTGAQNTSWLPRLRANPAVVLERAGETRAFSARVLEDESTLARIDRLMLEKYGWSEQLLRAAGSSPPRRVAIRLDPR